MSGWIGVDLDGTLADHYWPEKGPYDHTRIGEPLMPMVKLVHEMLHDGFEVRIFTARVSPTISRCSCHDQADHFVEAARLIEEWTLKHLGVALQSTATKDYRMMQLYDDRAMRVIYNEGTVCYQCASPIGP